MKILIIFLSSLLVVKAGSAIDAATAYKGQFCTDPRTMRKHAAYTEWADAYSCTRHRCQPGGRNLAIYTVGCKRVEAPESAIECEEVVEDTNMQFPYCCTRLRCLVVVRGEVWTRVLGQPWETLPAAPWSHMYKMKKPPPGEGTFPPKTEEGPVYELQMPETADANGGGDDKVLRSNKKPTDSPDCNDVVARAAPAPAPDIVIALSTGADKDLLVKKDNIARHMQGGRSNGMFEEGEARTEEEEPITEKEKQSEERYYANSQNQAKQLQHSNQVSGERYYENAGQKKQGHQATSWTEIPQNQWQDRDPPNENSPPIQQRSNIWSDRERHEPEALRMGPPDPPPTPNPAQTWEHQSMQSEFSPNDEVPRVEDKKKPHNLQALVDAIGTRMRDIESVVARMNTKVHETEPEKGFRSKDNEHNYYQEGKMKKANPDNDHYKSHSKYVRSSVDATTDQPLFVEDTNLNGYFSDASNSVINRRNPPKEPAALYMAPVGDTRRKSHPDTSGESEKKHKKKIHKKKHSKGHHKKHHSKEDKRRKFRLNSVELDRNAVSLEDSSGAGNSNANNGTFENSIDQN